jgi:hypothetical protein
VETIEAGLTAAGIPMRQSTLALKDHDAKKWRQYLLGLWRRHQHKPEVGTLYQSKLLVAQQLLSEFLRAHPHNKLPVTFDNWYTQQPFAGSYTKSSRSRMWPPLPVMILWCCNRVNNDWMPLLLSCNRNTVKPSNLLFKVMD